jgi:hypothetical protein
MNIGFTDYIRKVVSFDTRSLWRCIDFENGVFYSVLCSFELNNDAGKYLKKKNTHSYLCILSNMTNNNWFACILCYCKSNIDTTGTRGNTPF